MKSITSGRGSAYYKALFGAEKDDIGPDNTCFWDVKSE
jgi:hypothetical protein